jgi:MerR family transcriptional regulator, thiopeptide resistance regulator
MYRVKEVARMAGVSIRTLHHYDEIGLLVPSRRSGAGYRLYDDDDLLRLQQILIGRELGLALEEIRRSLDDPDFDRRRALEDQRAQLVRKAEQTAEMLRAIDEALAVLNGTDGGDVDMKDLFDGFDHAAHEEEARQRWGHTDAYRESARRTKNYTDEDWSRVKAEQADLYADAAALLHAGTPADAEASMDVAERLRLSIDRWFYPCPHAMHRNLADLYEGDRRFADNIDKHGAGLTDFLVEAIRANARRHGA